MYTRRDRTVLSCPFLSCPTVLVLKISHPRGEFVRFGFAARLRATDSYILLTVRVSYTRLAVDHTSHVVSNLTSR